MTKTFIDGGETLYICQEAELQSVLAEVSHTDFDLRHLDDGSIEVIAWEHVS